MYRVFGNAGCITESHPVCIVTWATHAPSTTRHTACSRLLTTSNSTSIHKFVFMRGLLGFSCSKTENFTDWTERWKVSHFLPSNLHENRVIWFQIRARRFCVCDYLRCRGFADGLLCLFLTWKLIEIAPLLMKSLRQHEALLVNTFL